MGQVIGRHLSHVGTNNMPTKVTQEICLMFWKDDKLVAIERKNGHMVRYMTQEANYGDTAELFGAHIAEKV